MKRLTNFLIVVSTYGALACLGIALTRTTWGVSSIWPANGLIVGLFYNGRNTRWSDLVSAVAIGGFIANAAFLTDRTAVPLFTFGNVIELVVLWISFTVSHASVSAVKNPRSLFWFLTCAVLFPVTVSAVTVGVASHLALGWPPLSVSRSWFVSDALGLLLFMPLGYVFRRAQRQLSVARSRQRSLEKILRKCRQGVFAHAIVLVVTIAAFQQSHWLPAYWVLPSVVLAVLWAGSYVAVTGTCIATALAVICTVGQPLTSPLGRYAGPEQAILAVQGFALACALASYLMASVLSDRRQYLTQVQTICRTQLDLAARLRAANDELATLAWRDPLTGLANRRRFDAALMDVSRVKDLDDGQIAILFIDVDWFKCFNDRYGHAFGDGVLRAVALAISDVLPVGSTFARIGGEEFAILCLVLDAAAAGELAESVVQQVRKLAIKHADSAYGVVTVSLGLMLCDSTHVADGARMLDLADAAMYRAKHEGRNRWVSLSHDESTQYSVDAVARKL